MQTRSHRSGTGQSQNEGKDSFSWFFNFSFLLLFTFSNWDTVWKETLRLWKRSQYYLLLTKGSLYDPVTWYGINCAGMQVTQYDIQKKGTCTSPALTSHPKLFCTMWLDRAKGLLIFDAVSLKTVNLVLVNLSSIQLSSF